MARISGTVSRNVPLDAVLGRPLTLSGAFDFYITGDELRRVTSTLDVLISSGLMTNHVRSAEDGGLIAGVTAPVVDPPNASGTAVPSPLQVVPFAIPDAAGTTYTYTAQKTMDVVDVLVHKVAVATGTTYQVQDASAAAITDAIAVTADKAVGRMATIDRTKNRIAAGTTFKIAVTRSTGSSQAELHLLVILR